MYPKKNVYHYVVFYCSIFKQKRMSFLLVTITCIHRERIVLKKTKKELKMSNSLKYTQEGSTSLL